MMEIPSVTSKKRKNLSSTTSPHQFPAKTPRLHSNPSFDQDSTSSCCSSGTDERIPNADLQDESGNVTAEVEASICYSERERKSETTAYSEVEEEEMSSSSEKQDSPREKTQRCKMPTESELQNFFTQAEQKLHKQFSDKYNYDVVKDVPLEGRYEWFKLNPSSSTTTNLR